METYGREVSATIICTKSASSLIAHPGIFEHSTAFHTSSDKRNCRNFNLSGCVNIKSLASSLTFRVSEYTCMCKIRSDELASDQRSVSDILTWQIWIFQQENVIYFVTMCHIFHSWLTIIAKTMDDDAAVVTPVRYSSILVQAFKIR